MCKCGVFVSLLGLTVILALTAPTANGQGSSEPRTLSGTVYYVGGNEPAENIPVELHSGEGSVIAVITTNSSGWFELHGLKRDIYVVSIRISGFEPVSFTVDLSLTSSRGNVIYLKTMVNSPTQPSQGSSVSAHELSMPQSARDLMDSGRKKFYKDKDAEGGLADFQRAVLISPGYYEACYQMAMAYIQLAKREDAEKSLRQSIEVSGDKYGEADIGLGTMMLDRDDFAGGEKKIRRGIELNPESWLGHYELGRALLNENRISEAQKSAEQARTLAPNVPIVYRLLSNVHLREKNYPALLEDLDAYIKLDPDSPAGLRAKEIREQVRQQVAANNPKPAAN